MAFRSNSSRFARWILTKFFVQFSQWNNQIHFHQVATMWMILSQLGESRFVTVKSWQLICINFYLWGDLKDKVYKICSCNEEELNIWKFFWNNNSFKSISDFLNSIIKVYVFRQHFSTSLNTGALTLIVWCRMTHIGKIL
jgi:hypothetical protein